MPSKLPIIKANTSQENIDKMKVIATANKRSVAKELEWLIEKHIAEYEAENGEIEIEEPPNIKALKEYAKMATDKTIPASERIKESFMIGFNAGAGKKTKEENKE